MCALRTFTNNISTHNTNTGTMAIEAGFGCDRTDHPLVICALDTTGNHWWLDGDYVRQTNEDYEHNQHPVWLKEGVYTLSYYLFLHTANNTDEWYWAITADDTFESDSSVMAYCSVGGSAVPEPSDCPLWSTTDLSLGEYSENDDFVVSAEACTVEDSYICIESNQSALGMLSVYICSVF